MARRERPMSQAEKERLAFIRKSRQALKGFDIEPVAYSGWTVGIGQSTPFPRDTEEYETPIVLESEEGEEAPPEEVKPTLPPPSEVKYIAQATHGGIPTSRPDLFDVYYAGGTETSTRVACIQWVPTMLSNAIASDLTGELYSGQAALIADVAEGPELLYGDILVAFARPQGVGVSEGARGSRHTLYVYEHNTPTTWDMFKNADSLGQTIRLLNGGRRYYNSDGARYLELHSGSEGSESYQWIFNDLEKFYYIREGNSRL